MSPTTRRRGRRGRRGRPRGADPPGRPGARVPLLVGPGQDRPAADRPSIRLVLLGLRGPPLPRLLLPAGQRQHRLPAPQAGRSDPGAGGQAVHDRAQLRQRRPLRGRPADRRDRPGGPQRRVLHQRWRGGQRERRTDGPAAHRPAQGPRRLPQLPRRHRRRHRADRRPAALAVRAGDAGHRAVLGALPLPLVLPCRERAGGVRAGAGAPARRHRVRGPGHGRRDRARDGRRHQRHPGARRTATSPACARCATSSAS